MIFGKVFVNGETKKGLLPPQQPLFFSYPKIKYKIYTLIMAAMPVTRVPMVWAR